MSVIVERGMAVVPVVEPHSVSATWAGRLTEAGNPSSCATGVNVKFGTQLLRGRFIEVLNPQFAPGAPDRTHVQLHMLRASLKAVFHPPKQTGFEDLLRQLDRTSPAR